MRVFLDENLSEHVASALNHLNKAHFAGIEVVSVKQVGWGGKPDTELIPLIGGFDGVLITKDTDFTPKVQAQFQLCKDHGVGIVFVKPIKGHDLYWEMVKLLIKNWERIMQICTTRRKPWAFILSARAFTELR